MGRRRVAVVTVLPETLQFPFSSEKTSVHVFVFGLGDIFRPVLARLCSEVKSWMSPGIQLDKWRLN